MSDDIQENDEITQLKKKRDDFKKAITHFYGEIARIRKNEERKYQFPITIQTCMDTISQCYEYITTLDMLHQFAPDEFEDFEVEMQTATMFLTEIEHYTHELEILNKKETEILNKDNAVPVISPEPHETKGRSRKTTTIKASQPKEHGKKSDDKTVSEPLKNNEGEVVEVINSHDVSKDELYQIKENPKPPEEAKPDPIIEKKAKDIVDTEKVDIEEDSPPPIQEKSEETLENSDLAIFQPDEKDEVNLKVVVDKNNKKDESFYREDEIEYTDNYPILTEDSTADDTDDTNIEEIQLINNDTNAENEDVIELTDDLKEFNIKAITRNKTNSFKAKLQRKNIDEKLISAIKLFPYDDNDENIRKEYLLSRNNMIASPHMSKTILLMSGYYVEIASYGSWNTFSLERAMRNENYDFVDKELIILNSIYDQIRYFSYTKTKPTFEEWLATVKYPDYEMLFYGLFDANYPGMNYFRIRCPYCGKEDILVGKENKDLAVAIDSSYTEEMLVEQITTKEMNKLDTSSHLPKWANTTRVRKMTNNTKILFDYEVPTLLDYVHALSTARRISQRDNQPLDLSNILNPESEEYSRILLYIYIKTVGLPSPIYGDPTRPKEPTSYKYIGLSNKADIIEIINSLDFDDYISLLTGDPVWELLLKRSVHYFVKDTKCTNKDCGKTIKYINLDPRKIFFSRTTEATRAIRL